MSRLIDADHAVLMLETNLTDEEKFEKCISVNDLITFIGQLPTVDAVPVVRCKDCKRCDTDTAHHKYFCMRYGMDIPGNWFCADGEKEKV